jgi:Protein of unknown function (DUF3040)
MMSISEREREVLDSMESDLARSDPRLASMLVMFSRLTADERMPVRKPVRSAGCKPGPRGLRRFRVGRKARGWLLLAAAAVLFVSMVIMTHGNRVSPCAHSLTAACERTHARLAGSVPESRR